jgi:hypothetical protein
MNHMRLEYTQFCQTRIRTIHPKDTSWIIERENDTRLARLWRMAVVGRNLALCQSNASFSLDYWKHAVLVSCLTIFTTSGYQNIQSETSYLEYPSATILWTTLMSFARKWSYNQDFVDQRKVRHISNFTSQFHHTLNLF